jgi:hypothetical protein
MMRCANSAFAPSLTTSLPQLRDAALSMLHIKRHYFGSHPSLNALGIIPAGPRVKAPTSAAPPRTTGCCLLKHALALSQFVFARSVVVPLSAKEHGQLPVTPLTSSPGPHN